MSLARDASSSGDPVLAENYLQHAEHYNRIIMAFRDQHMGPGGEMNGGMGRHRPFMTHDPLEPGDEFADEEGEDGEMQPPQPAMRQQEPQPQPRLDGQRFEGQRGGHEQHRFRDRPDRHERGGERGFPPARQQNADAGAEGASQQPSPEAQMRRRERFPQTHEQPEFLRRPVRRPRREGNGGPGDANGAAEDPDHD
jgi:hypothetical protein